MDVTSVDVWALRQPEENPEERAEEDMIEAEQRARVEVEIRRQVDYLMRQEIQRLKEVRRIISVYFCLLYCFIISSH